MGELPDSGVGELAVGAAQVASTWWVRGRERESRRRLAGHVRRRAKMMPHRVLEKAVPAVKNQLVQQ